GMKRGIIEMIDGMAINKADGDTKAKAEQARSEYAGALHLFPPSPDGWAPRVLTCSARTGDGVAQVWQMILDHRRHLESGGLLAQRRSAPALEWMKNLISAGLEDAFRRHPAVEEHCAELSKEVEAGRMSPLAASRALLSRFRCAIIAS